MNYRDELRNVYKTKNKKDLCLAIRGAMLQEADDMKDNFMEQLLVKRLKFYADLLDL